MIETTTKGPIPQALPGQNNFAVQAVTAKWPSCSKGDRTKGYAESYFKDVVALTTYIISMT
jgi:hypothetical protein